MNGGGNSRSPAGRWGWRVLQRKGRAEDAQGTRRAPGKDEGPRGARDISGCSGAGMGSAPQGRTLSTVLQPQLLDPLPKSRLPWTSRKISHPRLNHPEIFWLRVICLQVDAQEY